MDKRSETAISFIVGLVLVSELEIGSEIEASASTQSRLGAKGYRSGEYSRVIDHNILIINHNIP